MGPRLRRGPRRLQTGICAVLFGTHFLEELEALTRSSSMAGQWAISDLYEEMIAVETKTAA